jgi:hypothetical protein
MTINLALEYIPKRMCELGYGAAYFMRFRHLLLQPGEARTVAAHGQLFLLVEPPNDIRIESDSGFYDLSDSSPNEFQYEHQGGIVITNLSAVSGHVRFIQVIPKNCTCYVGD